MTGPVWLAGSGEAAGVGCAAACGEGGELAFDFLGVTLWALEVGVGVGHTAQEFEHFSALTALVFV